MRVFVIVLIVFFSGGVLLDYFRHKRAAEYKDFTPDDIDYMAVDCPKSISREKEKTAINLLLGSTVLESLGQAGDEFHDLPIYVVIVPKSSELIRIKFSRRESIGKFPIMTVEQEGFNLGTYNAENLYEFLYKECFSVSAYFVFKRELGWLNASQP